MATVATGLRMRIGQLFGRLAEMAGTMTAAGVWPRAVVWSCLADLADVATVGACLAATGVGLGVPDWFVIFVAINLAIAVPSTPGQLGVLEAGAVLALVALGVRPGEALSFALLYHAAHAVPVTAIGLLVAAGARQQVI